MCDATQLGFLKRSPAWQALLLLFVPLVLAAVLDLGGGRSFFRPYVGALDPAVAVAVAAVVGAAALTFLQRRGWFKVVGEKVQTGVFFAAVLATVIAAPVIAVDAAAGISVTNVPWPSSVLFYPAIATVAEVVFHVVPLAVCAAIVALFVKSHPVALVGGCLAVVSLLEPAYQLRAGVGNWIDAYVWLHVWTINLLQLVIFWRFDFASMFAFRLVYYFWWHVLWGALRPLELY